MKVFIVLTDTSEGQIGMRYGKGSESKHKMGVAETKSHNTKGMNFSFDYLAINVMILNGLLHDT